MKVYVVRGRHGELAVFADADNAFKFWAETNGYDSFADFYNEFEDEFEFSEGRWFLDECGHIDLVEVQ